MFVEVATDPAVPPAVADGGVTTEPVLFPEVAEVLVDVAALVLAEGAAGFPIQCTTQPFSNLKVSITLPSSIDGIILPLKIRRIEPKGIVVASDASLCNVDDGAGEGSSSGIRRGGFMREREIVIMSLLSLILKDYLYWA